MSRAAAWGCPGGWNVLVRNGVKGCLPQQVLCALGEAVPCVSGAAIKSACLLAEVPKRLQRVFVFAQ